MMPIFIIRNVVGVVGAALEDLEVGWPNSICLGKARFARWRYGLYIEGLPFTHFQPLSWSQGLIVMSSLPVKRGGKRRVHG